MICYSLYTAVTFFTEVATLQNYIFLKSTRRDLFKNDVYLGNLHLYEILQECEADWIGAKCQISDLHHPTIGHPSLEHWKFIPGIRCWYLLLAIRARDWNCKQGVSTYLPHSSPLRDTFSKISRFCFADSPKHNMDYKKIQCRNRLPWGRKTYSFDPQK